MIRHKAGDTPGKGYYCCTKCGRVLYLDTDETALPNCPECGAPDWEKLT